MPELDGALDLRVDDFAGPDDPGWTGWHRLEYLLWMTNTTAGGSPLADRLDRDFAGNVQGSTAAYSAFRAVLRTKKPALVTDLDGWFAAMESSLAKYEVGGGYQPYRALAGTDRTRMSAELAALSEEPRPAAGRARRLSRRSWPAVAHSGG